MIGVSCLLVPSAVIEILIQSPSARATVPLCVPEAMLLLQVSADASRAVPELFVMVTEEAPASTRHLIPVIVTVLPVVFGHSMEGSVVLEIALPTTFPSNLGAQIQGWTPFVTAVTDPSAATVMFTLV